MYTFDDDNTGELIPFDSIDELTLIEAKDYISGETSAYIVEIEGVRHRVNEAFYNKVKEEKGM